MLFNSFAFAVFFALCFSLYLVLPRRAQNRMLLLASYVFYGAWDWRFLGLIWLSTAIDFAVGLRLDAAQDPRVRRRWIAFSVAAGLSILGAFKYADFFAEGLADLLRPLGLELPPFALDVVLPVGISFYTFQTLGYTLDVYRRRVPPARDWLDFALFVAFFPQLVAGPIERAGRLLPQIQRERSVTWEGVGLGAWWILWGVFKKAVVADNLAPLVDAVYAPASTPTAPEVLLATYAFALQIYCDFSGYTDIARGTARMLGFDLMRNFALPYFARSPAEFWRRWHISLSTWLRDYLYVPLGGNRGGPARTARNLALTMLLGGLWHGAAWTFVGWGAYHGALLVGHRAARPWLARLAPRSRLGAAGWELLCGLATFHAICLGWVLFRAESLSRAAGLLGSLAGPWEAGLAGRWLLPLAALAAPVVAMQIAQAAGRSYEVVFRWRVPVRAALYVALFYAVVLLGEDLGQPFLYFQF